MNEKYFGQDINTSDIAEGTIVDMDNPVVITDPVAGKVVVDDTFADETEESKSIPDKASIGELFPHEVSIGESFPQEAPVGVNAGSSVALLTPEDSQRFRTTWNEVQGKFVDEPRSAVQQADALVSEVIKQLTQMFANEHTSLEGLWQQGKDVSTEDLRQALLHYHSFFNRLVV